MYLDHDDLSRYWILDVEADSLTPTKIYVTVVRNCKSNEVIRLFSADDWDKFTKDDHIYVTHNGVSFDIPLCINRLWNGNISLSRVVDTLVLSYLYHPYIPDGHSLAAWGQRLGLHKIEFHDFSKLTEEMIIYCERDTEVTLRVFLALTDRMKKRGFSELSCWIEHNFRDVINDQQNNGFCFDVQSAISLYDQLRRKESELASVIKERFPAKRIVTGTYKYKLNANGTVPVLFLRRKEKYELNWLDDTTYETVEHIPFNIGSPSQRVERLLELGWEPKTFTPTGQPKVDEDSLLAFSEISGVPEVKLIAEWLVHNGRANMINTWLENTDLDGFIRGQVNSCGAGTRRCTHNSPNTANIPGSDAQYGKECRALWTARKGRSLVGIDASGLEGRVFIHYLGSKEAETFMLNDPHTANAKAISAAVGFEVKRGPTKNLFYARLYGASDGKLGSMLKYGAAIGAIVREAIDGNIPGFKSLVEQIDVEWKKQGTFITTIDGGFVRCGSPHAALNYKFQSCGAIVMKLAAIIHRDWLREHKLDAIKVGDIHDEWQFDCHPNHAEQVGILGCAAIKEAGKRLNMNIELDGEYKIGRTWADTH